MHKDATEFYEYLSVIVLSISCHALKPQQMLTTFDKQGHRGCRALMPENTVPAMFAAIDLGVSTLELDVVITKDKQVLVSHEPFFNHEITTKPDGAFVSPEEERSLNIYEMTLDETRKYDVGLKPHPRFPGQKKIRIAKPLLSELIKEVEAYCIRKNLKAPYYNIETKCDPQTDNIYHPEPEGFIHLLMDVITKKNVSTRVIVQSFDIRTLQELHGKHPTIKTALLIDENNISSFKQNVKALGFAPTIYSPHYSLVTTQLIASCNEENVLIIPWTVNDKNQIHELKQAGVDGIITDDPTLFN